MAPRSASPRLRVITTAAPADDPRHPEDLMGFLFAREAQLVADLAAVRRALDVQRVRYSTAQRLRIFVSLDTLRRRFGPRRDDLAGTVGEANPSPLCGGGKSREAAKGEGPSGPPPGAIFDPRCAHGVAAARHCPRCDGDD